jgi:hypothetical protein
MDWLSHAESSNCITRSMLSRSAAQLLVQLALPTRWFWLLLAPHTGAKVRGSADRA